jgi:ubiquinone/menaquinone biosynthesis C-methylase UbiE
MKMTKAYQSVDARREFDSWSRRYDWDPLQFLFFRPAHRMVLEMLDATDERVLDVGCGTGVLEARIHERFPETQVWGLDLSEGMLSHAKKRCRAAGERIHLVRGDSERLPFADNAFDVVTCCHSFHHYPNAKGVLAEMHRVLRPGGRLLIVDGDRDGLWGRLIFDGLVVWVEGPVRHWSRAGVRDLYEEAGFNQIHHRRRGGPLPFLLTAGRAKKPRGVAAIPQVA